MFASSALAAGSVGAGSGVSAARGGVVGAAVAAASAITSSVATAGAAVSAEDILTDGTGFTCSMVCLWSTCWRTFLCGYGGKRLPHHTQPPSTATPRPRSTDVALLHAQRCRRRAPNARPPRQRLERGLRGVARRAAARQQSRAAAAAAVRAGGTPRSRVPTPAHRRLHSIPSSAASAWRTPRTRRRWRRWRARRARWWAGSPCTARAGRRARTWPSARP